MQMFNFGLNIDYYYVLSWKVPQLTFTCSNSARETLEKGVEYVQS